MRSQLKHAKEQSEENTYEAHLDLITEPNDKENIDPAKLLSTKNLPQLSTNVNFENTTRAIVFFDLETSALKGSCEILQIAARCGDRSFCEYINPKYAIPISASSVNGLTKVGRDMFFHGKKVPSKPLRVVLGELLEFLKNCEKKMCFDCTQLQLRCTSTSQSNK